MKQNNEALEAFDKILRKRGLDTTKKPKGEWGDATYKYEHIECMFNGYCIALTAQAEIAERDRVMGFSEIPDDCKISDDEIDAVWGNANFGENANKRKIILNALQQVAADYSTGSTARRICQELKLIGDPRNPYDAKLTKKGRRVMYHWNKALSEYTKLDHIVHVHEKVEAVDVEETSVFELHSKIDMDIEDVYGRELTGAESILIGTCLRILKQQGHLRAKLPKIEGLTQQLIESKRYGDRYDVGRAIMQAAQAYNDMSEE